MSVQKEVDSMKRMKCMIVFLLVAGLAVSAPKSNAMSKKVKKQYTKVLGCESRCKSGVQSLQDF